MVLLYLQCTWRKNEFLLKVRIGQQSFSHNKLAFFLRLWFLAFLWPKVVVPKIFGSAEIFLSMVIDPYLTLFCTIFWRLHKLHLEHILLQYLGPDNLEFCEHWHPKSRIYSTISSRLKKVKKRNYFSWIILADE